MQRRAPIILIPAPWGRHSTLKGSKRSQTHSKDGTGTSGVGCNTYSDLSSKHLKKKDLSESTVFHVPPSAPYIEELQRCWADPRRFSPLPGDCRALANMQDASAYGLDRMPNNEPAGAAIVLTPGEALPA